MAAMMTQTPGMGGGMMGGGMMGGGMAGGASSTDPPYAGFLANGRLGPIDSAVPGIVLPLVYAGERPTLAPVFVWPSCLTSGKRLAYSDLRPVGESLPLASARAVPLTLSAGVAGAWAINGEAYPNADPLEFRLGERIRFQFRNMSMVRLSSRVSYVSCRTLP